MQVLVVPLALLLAAALPLAPLPEVPPAGLPVVPPVVPLEAPLVDPLADPPAHPVDPLPAALLEVLLAWLVRVRPRPEVPRALAGRPPAVVPLPRLARSRYSWWRLPRPQWLPSLVALWSRLCAVWI